MQQPALNDSNKSLSVSAAAPAAGESDLLLAIHSLLGPEAGTDEGVSPCLGAAGSSVLASLASGLMASQSPDPLASAPVADIRRLPRKRREQKASPTPSVANPLPAGLTSAQRAGLERFLASAEGPKLAALLGNVSYRELPEAARLKLLGDLAQHSAGMGVVISGLLSVAQALDVALLGKGEKASVLEICLALPDGEAPNLEKTVRSGRLTDSQRGRGNLLDSLHRLSRQASFDFEGKAIDARQLLVGVLRVVAGRSAAV